MDKLVLFITGNLLLLILCGTVVLSLLLFLFYLRCILKTYILKRKRTLSYSSSFPSELSNGSDQDQRKSPTADVELETETTILMIPQGSDLNKFEENESSHFFRLPSDRRKSSYFKFNSVDELNVSNLTNCYQERSSRPVTYYGRRGRRLFRQGTWDKAMIGVLSDNDKDDDNKGNFKKSIITSLPTSIHGSRLSFRFEADNFQIFGANNKEVLI